jgi:hypothetical protein
MAEVLTRLADRIDITHAALLLVIGALVWLLVKRERHALETARMTADALSRTAEALTTLRVELARRSSR